MNRLLKVLLVAGLGVFSSGAREVMAAPPYGAKISVKVTQLSAPRPTIAGVPVCDGTPVSAGAQLLYKARGRSFRSLWGAMRFTSADESFKRSQRARIRSAYQSQSGISAGRSLMQDNPKAITKTSVTVNRRTQGGKILFSHRILDVNTGAYKCYGIQTGRVELVR